MMKKNLLGRRAKSVLIRAIVLFKKLHKIKRIPQITKRMKQLVLHRLFKGKMNKNRVEKLNRHNPEEAFQVNFHLLIQSNYHLVF